MRDDEKMFNIGVAMAIAMVFFVIFLQVCDRVQNTNLKFVRRSLANTRHEYALAETRFSALTAADLLRSSVVGINPKAATVSYSKNVNVNDIPMVNSNEI